ncbi:dTDP-glucose 4,6-dehydratase [Streptomyces sp. CB02923]|uniref:dTDP-glucose 4,6-dehydratase n=1 Tax=Streptomyces sp. CB02923 TaxID=1718985 RepID=UPI00093F0754|nr:dTDP-glucose 4,6-dehydratase [Streptomyces sp. CB02923]OKI07179.1 dTDP-glucose 4,6-dehydratase [Streptomyces sp. CB02923]
MRLLVTGGAGFIGSHYVRALLGGGFGEDGDAHTRLTVLDRLTYAGSRASLPARHPRLDFVHGDICDLPLLLSLLPGHDAVVHFAAETHVDRSLAPDTAPDFVRTNVLGTQTLLDACLRTGVSRMVHISTDEVYGSLRHGAWTEDQPVAPRSPYAASKAAADLFALACHHTHGLDVSVTRCCNTYGPYQHPEKLVPCFVTRLLEGRELPLYGDGRNVREWLHVDDHCRAVHRVLHHGRAGEIYHVGGGVPRTNLALTGQLLRLCGADWSRVRRVPDRKGHDRRYALDTTKIRTELGHAPRTGFARGLADTVAWYRDNPQWWKEAARR